MNWFQQTTRKGHCFGVQKKEPSRDEVSARRCKTCLELASLVLVDQDFHFQNQVVSMSLGLKFLKKEVKRCWAAAAMCNDKQGIELYPATSAIEKTRASPLPPTSHTMPMLFGKCKCQVKLWWATCSDAPPCFHPTPPFFRYQHFWFNQTVWKEGRGSIIIFPRSMRVKMLLELEGNHSRTPGADWWPAISQANWSA